MASWSSRLAILLPLLGAIVQYGLRRRVSHILRLWLTLVLLASTASLALIHFIVNELRGCLFLAGDGNCFVSGLGALATAGLLLGLAAMIYWRSRRQRAPTQLNHMRLLIFVAAFSGLTVGENLFVVILSLLGLYASLDYWLRHRGLRWGFLVLRDDYKDDIG